MACVTRSLFIFDVSLSSPPVRCSDSDSTQMFSRYSPYAAASGTRRDGSTVAFGSGSVEINRLASQAGGKVPLLPEDDFRRFLKDFKIAPGLLDPVDVTVVSHIWCCHPGRAWCATKSCLAQSAACVVPCCVVLGFDLVWMMLGCLAHDPRCCA